MRFNFISQRGFTLVEVLTVMLVLVAIASITVESTKDFVFQGRYDITKDRYEKIKKAIIGDPNQVINGQPNISGFVADMGRLPRNLHELLVQNYCDNDYRISDNTPDSVIVAVGCPTGISPSQCCTTKTPAGNWIPQTAWNPPTATTLGYGWHGPYITAQQPDYEGNALPDGWGNQATADTIVNASNQNYGWGFCLGDSLNISTAPYTCNTTTLLNQRLIIKSLGKDGKEDYQALPSTTYDSDYPQNITISTTKDFIRNSDWTVDVNGIQANVMASGFRGTCRKQPVSMPSSTMCQGGTFSELSQPTDKLTCEAANGTWNSTASTCSGVNIPICSWTQQQMCSLASGIWLTSLNSTTCNSLGGIWNNTTSICSGVTPPPLCSISKSLCDSNGGSWQPSSSTICMTMSYRYINPTTGQTEIQPIKSNSTVPIPTYQTITEDGREHLISFPFFNDTITANGTQDVGEEDIRIPFGSVDIGIYTDCNTGTMPVTRYRGVSQDIRLTLYPNTTLPTINW